MGTVCDVCYRGCNIEEGKTGACFARENKEGVIVPLTYGRITSMAIDPIEKKPLARFFPGSRILSIGSYGCNLKCPFCQNVEISMADGRKAPGYENVSPGEICEIAKNYIGKGNIGVAYTYNEPLVCYEFVRDTAELVKEAGMKNVLVTNGCVTQSVAEKVLPYIDALNIDLKSFMSEYYRDVLKGDLKMVKAFIKSALATSHVELTTLVIPGENDSEEHMRDIASWISSLEKEYDKKIPLHISRFFPMSRYSDRMPTPVSTIYRLADIAREKLDYVYEGNV